ncbi:cell division protein ZapA [Sphingosinicella sp. LHD-64]|uniref:cell division protein ZapA n=1 Tax=Sphingosinicella sp. LHD-64 TaxID=3072139 RepID=UPI00280E784F|nr:cell division protein ZapA [Sphingosinicella sp. LHD-64]MDQ8754739.1 cell division protein ZapA [Sphingosinicella sp. LHD-64]
MANIDVEVAGRRYNVACRDGEEDHLRGLAAVVDKRAQDAAEALGGLTESRQLLFAALLIADDLKEVRAGNAIPDPVPPQPDPAVADALERLAGRLESLVDRLEAEAQSA